MAFRWNDNGAHEEPHQKRSGRRSIQRNDREAPFASGTSHLPQVKTQLRKKKQVLQPSNSINAVEHPKLSARRYKNRSNGSVLVTDADENKQFTERNTQCGDFGMAAQKPNKYGSTYGVAVNNLNHETRERHVSASMQAAKYKNRSNGENNILLGNTRNIEEQFSDRSQKPGDNVGVTSRTSVTKSASAARIENRNKNKGRNNIALGEVEDCRFKERNAKYGDFAATNSTTKDVTTKKRTSARSAAAENKNKNKGGDNIALTGAANDERFTDRNANCDCFFNSETRGTSAAAAAREYKNRNNGVGSSIFGFS